MSDDVIFINSCNNIRPNIAGTNIELTNLKIYFGYFYTLDLPDLLVIGQKMRLFRSEGASRKAGLLLVAVASEKGNITTTTAPF